MNSGIGRFRILAALGALTIAMSVSVSSAAASDTFSLKNGSKTAVLQGLSLWGKGNTMAKSCRTGPFPGPTLAPFTFNPGNRGSITLTQNPFSDCLPGVNPLVDNQVQGPDSNGAWVWIPVDPFIGSAHLTCTVLAQTGSKILEASVDGLTCTITDAGSTTSGNFVSSAAPLRSGKAVAYIQHFPTSKNRNSRAAYTVVLRSGKGAFLGRKRVTVAAGKPKRVRLPVPKAVRKRVNKKSFASVKAIVRRADGKKGSGDRTTLTVRRGPVRIPFQAR